MILPEQPALELMSPAGSYPSLTAAIRAGADAVYFGVDRLNMRARTASAFATADIRKVARICHWCGVRCYLVLNTLVYDDELDTVRQVCDAAKQAGVDAVIACDLAVIEYARQGGLPVHVSVQANIGNLSAVRFYARYAEAMVLARELTLEQIHRIAHAVRAEKITAPSGRPVRLEAFAHGALCVAIAGKCYMSLAVYNASANRGACYQNCRRKYRITDVETGAALEIDNQYVMSPKDLCTIEYLDQLAAAGITIFKIEGRARSAHYVATVTSIYREALDALQNGTYQSLDWQRLKDRLRTVFNRGFWEGGYYAGRKLGEWSGSGHSQATRRRVEIGLVENFFAQPQVMEFTLWQSHLRPGTELLIEGPTTGAVTITVTELRVDGRPADRAAPGDKVTLKSVCKLRRRDKIFLLEPTPSPMIPSWLPPGDDDDFIK